MIETCSAYKIGNDTFVSLKEAQVHALIQTLFPSADIAPAAEAAIQEIVAQKDKVIPILTMNEPAPKTRKPRSDQGKQHRKKRAVVTTPEPAPIESTVTGSGKYSGQ